MLGAYVGLCWLIFSFLEAMLAPSWLQLGHLGALLGQAMLGSVWAHLGGPPKLMKIIVVLGVFPTETHMLTYWRFLATLLGFLEATKEPFGSHL